jgi:hypothetical protein
MQICSWQFGVALSIPICDVVSQGMQKPSFLEAV